MIDITEDIKPSLRTMTQTCILLEKLIDSQRKEKSGHEIEFNFI